MAVYRGQIDTVVLDGFGDPVVGARVQILQRHSTTLAAIWMSDQGAGELANPCFTDVYGRVPGWLNRGAYDLNISHQSIAPYTEYIDIAPAGDNSIDTAWLQDGCVTDSKLSGTLSSGSIGAGAVGTTQLADGAVTDVKVNASGISGAKIQAGTLPTAALANGAVATAKLADGAVTDVKVTSVGGSKLVDGTVTGAKLASATVQQSNMATDSVGSAQIAAGAVGTSEIADGSVTPAKLATASGGIPTGVVLPYAGPSAPSGFVFCDGATYDGTNPTYTPLWTIIGLTYGGTAQSAFKVPDMQGRVPVGKGTHADVNALAKNEGVPTVSARRPRHAHSIVDPGHTHDGTHQYIVTSGGAYGWQTGSGPAHDQPIPSATTGITVGLTGGSVDSEPFLVLNYIIKL